jgi:hypothetical protein
VLNVVHSAIHALAVLRVQDYVVDMRYVQSAAVDCDGTFRAGGAGEARESPMRKVNQDAIDLTTVAMLIVTLLK